MTGYLCMACVFLEDSRELANGKAKRLGSLGKDGRFQEIHALDLYFLA